MQDRHHARFIGEILALDQLVAMRGARIRQDLKMRPAARARDMRRVGVGLEAWHELRRGEEPRALIGERLFVKMLCLNATRPSTSSNTRSGAAMGAVESAADKGPGNRLRSETRTRRWMGLCVFINRVLRSGVELSDGVLERIALLVALAALGVATAVVVSDLIPRGGGSIDPVQLADSPIDLRKQPTDRVILAALTKPDLPWAWNELERRPLSVDEARQIIDGLTAWLQREHPSGLGNSGEFVWPHSRSPRRAPPA